MVHNPKHKVHSFRGLLGHDGQDEINLERQNLNLAYRITKFEIMPNTPGGAVSEYVVKVYREQQTSITQTVDFSDTDLLAAGYFLNQSSTTNPYYSTVIFDNILFSRNVFVTNDDNVGSLKCNYYLEIEEVPVSPSTLMQLKLGVARTLSLSQ